MQVGEDRKSRLDHTNKPCQNAWKYISDGDSKSLDPVPETALLMTKMGLDRFASDDSRKELHGMINMHAVV